MWNWFRKQERRAARAPSRAARSWSFRPRLEGLEDRQLLSGATYVATGSDFGSPPLVHVYNSSGTLLNEFYAYDPSFLGGVFVGSY